MIAWVYQRARLVEEFDEVLVATDDERIRDCVEGFGGKAVLTPGNLASGTDRVAHVAQNSDADIIMNLQGDEPLISPQLLSDVCKPFAEDNVQMTTAIKNVSSVEELKNLNTAWVVVDKNMDALYFSRAVIPVNFKQNNHNIWIKNHSYYEHVGIYVFRRNFLSELTKFPRGNLEKMEDLEQLRVLENGYKIRCVLTSYQSVCVDTPNDIKKVEQLIKKKKITLDA